MPKNLPNSSGYVTVRGAREHNLKNVDLDIPRDALVVFTGVSGSGKSSLAFGTLYAEAQRRYLESVSPYARRLFHQMGVPEVDSIEGLPPAIALQQQRGTPTTRSSVGSVTTLSNLIRMLYSRAGDYPAKQPLLYAESFSPNTPEGACPRCHGLGRVYEVTERTMVPNDRLTIRERAIAAWPTAWHGQNLRDILTTLGYEVDKAWRELSKKDRDWILFTEEQPVVPVYAGFTHEEIKQAIKRKEPPSYMGTFSSARRHVMHSFANTQSPLMKKRAMQYMLSTECSLCHGKRLRKESLSVRFAGLDIAECSRLPLGRLASLMQPYLKKSNTAEKAGFNTGEKAVVIQRIVQDCYARLQTLLDLGLGYLSLERSTPTLSPGELQRLRLATQVRSNLFGVVYVLDEPSAGLHPADTQALLKALAQLKAGGNSLFVVEHDLDVIREADWLVDVGPAAGEQGGEILYSGLPDGLRSVTASKTRQYLFAEEALVPRTPRTPIGWLSLEGITRNNIKELSVRFPLGVMTTVTGVSGSGKSSLVSQALVELVAAALGQHAIIEEDEVEELERSASMPTGGRIAGGMSFVRRLVRVDQKPIGRTPRSNLATYTGLFDNVRKLFAGTKTAKARHYDAGRFSFNVAKGRCPTCEGEGFVMVELLFLPSVYAPCPTCHGARYNEKTLEIKYKEKNIAEVLQMTVEAAFAFFEGEPLIRRSLDVLLQVGLGYIRLGQAATELSGGEAQRIKLATELQRPQKGDTLYVLDEPTTGLHPADVEKLVIQLDSLVAAGNTVILVEHEMRVVTASDWVIDIGPGAGEEGGRVVVAGTPTEVAASAESRTAPWIRKALKKLPLLVLFLAIGFFARSQDKPLPIIFDSDMGPDYDDVGAIALLHAFADSGKATILATMASDSYEGVAAVLNLFNTYYHRPDIPVGVPKGRAVDQRDFQHWTDSILAKYPHAIRTNSEAADAVTLYRQILSRQPDHSVVIVTVGFLTNLAGLLASPPDNFSRLDGQALVKKKVSRLVSMAGAFPHGWEFNVFKDSTASAYVFDNWPTPIVFSGFDIGKKIKVGLPLMRDVSIQNDPVRDVFRISIPLAAEDSLGRSSWDETAVLVAIAGYSPWYTLQKGTIHVAPNGSNTWEDTSGGKQAHLVEARPPAEVQEVIERLIRHQPK